MGVVPIVNENDTVSVSVSHYSCLMLISSHDIIYKEIQFGDNDTLSAITSSMVHADYLFLLTDVDGLYTANPRKNPDAKQIEVVDSIPAIRLEGKLLFFFDLRFPFCFFNKNHPLQSVPQHWDLV